MDDLQRDLDRCVAAGRAVALATVVAGPGQGSRLLVGAAGDTRGDLGGPRLNQRAALYAEQLLEKGVREARKSFQTTSGIVEVRFETHAGASAPGKGG
jgi:xanthine/CO dehydrogenase XdhC/CoxF family maturation factor